MDPVAVWCGSETRYALLDLSFSILYDPVVPPSATLSFLLCVLILASFCFLGLFCFVFLFFLSSGFPSLLCAHDVRRRLRALCQHCPVVPKLCLLLFVCVCRLACLGGRQQLQTLVCGITCVWGTIGSSCHINVPFFNACSTKNHQVFDVNKKKLN